MGRTVSRSWVWQLAAPPETLWPVLADTARLNEAAALPKYQAEDLAQADGSVLRLARARLGGYNLEWEEHPFEWVERRFYRQTRVFRRGPFKRFSARLEIEPAAGGTRATYTLAVESGGLLGELVLRMGFLEKAGRAIERQTRAADAFAAGQRTTAYDYAAPELPAGARERLAAMARRIEGSGYGHGLAGRLADFVTGAQEVDLMRLRPLKLATAWGAPSRHVIELCLEAARTGLLALQWDLLCPRCRGAKLSVATLEKLPASAHCSSCNIDYDGNFSRNIELTFRPTPAVRSISSGEYCLNGPMATPHVMVQQILQPGETRELAADLPPGRYRLRTLERGGSAELEFDGAGFPEGVADGEQVSAGGAAPPGTIRLVNRGARPLTLVIEDRAWVREALTAHRVSAMQAFRDLFASETLQAGEDVAIDNVALMFTDLAGSTALYERIGDGPAYRLVRDHFAFLAETVRAHDGALVKTIGDAVMAAFPDPGQAIAAALAVQQRVATFNAAQAADQQIVLKMGLHGGPCIAVTLNGRLDYFGSAVNLAARLQQQSQGADLVISEGLAADPAVADALARYPMRRESATLKGFARAVLFRRLGQRDILLAA